MTVSSDELPATNHLSLRIFLNCRAAARRPKQLAGVSGIDFSLWLLSRHRLKSMPQTDGGFAPDSGKVKLFAAWPNL
jgi:hypothetical protein